MTIRQLFNIHAAHSSWHTYINQALETMDPDYLETLYTNNDWLPGAQHIFNAFSLPLTQTHYVLFGESPYPRSISANGYAFWDAAVGSLWSETGLSKPVNRATSLRNILKMLLIAEDKLTANDTSQPAIAALDKKDLIQTNQELFHNLLAQGFLLLNATPILRPKLVKQDAKAWQPFIKHILHVIYSHRPTAQLILFGNIANLIDKLLPKSAANRLYAEHPYNISFINNQDVIHFFKPLRLLQKQSTKQVVPTMITISSQI